MRVKIFSTKYHKDLEDDINDWLAQTRAEVTSISFAEIEGEDNFYCTAIVLYKETKETLVLWEHDD